MAAIRDAVARIRDVLPGSGEAFRENRAAREIVILNLFIALQEAIALATHWLADEGWDVPQRRNLIAHQYGAVDAGRIFDLASNDVGNLLSFCQQLAQHAKRG